MKTNLSLVGIILLVFFAIGCNKKNKLKDFDYGRVENNKYYNSFFDLEVSLPQNWVIQTKEQTDNMTEKGKDLIAGDDKNMKAVLSSSEINSVNLLAVFQYEVGSAVDYNPNFILVAENLKNFPGIKTGSDYLYHSRKLLKQTQIQYDTIDEVFKKQVVNNKDFYVMNVTLNYLGIKINQKYYSTIQNGFCISAIISYINDDQKNGLEKVINSIKFNKL